VDAKGLHVITPEYKNGSFPGVLKYSSTMLKFPRA